MCKGPPGPPGEVGPTGATGHTGASAFDIVMDTGFVGTPQEWLNTLVGPTGPTGPKGDTCVIGPTGIVNNIYGNGLLCRNFVGSNGPAPIGKHRQSKLLTHYAGPTEAKFNIGLIIDAGSSGIDSSGAPISINIYNANCDSNLNDPNSWDQIGSYEFRQDVPANTSICISFEITPTFSPSIFEISSEDIGNSVGLIEVCL
jgi:hypothetical protein